MADVNPDLKPIMEMFAVQLKHPNVVSTLKDWKNTFARGMFNFGRRENLSNDLDFNLLVYTELNPAASKNGRKLTLEPKLDLVGVISNRKLAHEKFRYMKNEMVIVRASGRWDYAANEGPKDIKIAEQVTVRAPAEAGAATKAASERLLKEASKQCFSWLVVNKLTQGV